MAEGRRTLPYATYVPEPDYHGPDSFTFTAHYGLAISNEGTVNITVESVNDPPIATDDEAETTKGAPVVIDVLANDYDMDNDPLSVASVTQGSKGSVDINPDETVTYTPGRRFKGSDTFTYTCSDGNGGEATATVTVTAVSKGKGKGGGKPASLRSPPRGTADCSSPAWLRCQRPRART